MSVSFKSSAIFSAILLTTVSAQYYMYFLNEIENHTESGRGCSKYRNTISSSGVNENVQSSGYYKKTLLHNQENISSEPLVGFSSCLSTVGLGH